MISDYVSLTDKEEYQLLAAELKSAWLYILTAIAIGVGLWLGWPMAYAPLLLLIPALLIDVRHMILPDIITIPLLFLGLLFAPMPLASSLIGAGVGLLFFGVLEYTMTRLLGRPALGWGDVKLLGALGAWGGLLSLPLTLLFASWSAMAFILYRNFFTAQDRRAPFPFGPFLIIGGGVSILYQTEIWRWIASF